MAALVAAVSGSAGADVCGPDLHGECAALTQMLSMRMGLVVGGTAVLMLLVVAGLLRMVALDEAGHDDGPQTVWDRWE